MENKSLSEQMSDLKSVSEDQLKAAGPFVAISRQYGCGDFSLGLLLLDLLAEEATEDKHWQIYHKEILESLATETNLAMDVIQRQRREKPRLLSDFFRTLAGKKDRIPSGTEIRNRINSIIQNLAIEGCAILVGQGSSIATADIPNGMIVRLEAPVSWRVKQIAFREGLSETQAKIRLKEEEQASEYLEKIHQKVSASRPPYNMVFDCSKFTLSQIAVLIHRAMKLTKII